MSPNYNNRNSRPAQRPQGNAPCTPSEEIKALQSVEKLRDLEAHHLVKLAEKIGRDTARTISHTQIYRIHEHIVRICTTVKAGQRSTGDIQLLRYHLAYAVGRAKPREQPPLKDLAGLLGKALDKVSEAQDLERFRQLFEAILAYHKFHGGRN